MKDKISKIINSKIFPFVVLFLIMFSFNIFKDTATNDDVWFSKVTTGAITNEVQNMSEYMKWRFDTWSSRLLIEFFLIKLCMSAGIVWKILDAIIWAVLAYVLYKVFCSKENSVMRWLSVGFVLLIPQDLLCSAGWIATTVNYTWVITFGLICLIPIRKCLDDKKIKWYEYVIYICSMLYACNAEQMCLVLWTVWTIFIIYFIIKKKLKVLHVLLYIISIVSLILILKCPGNKARIVSETKTFFPEFESLSIVQKLEISCVSTMQYYIYNFNFIYFILTLLLLINILKKYPKNFLTKIIVMFPFLVGIMFNLGANITSMIAPDIYKIMENMNTNSATYITRREH